MEIWAQWQNAKTAEVEMRKYIVNTQGFLYWLEVHSHRFLQSPNEKVIPWSDWSNRLPPVIQTSSDLRIYLIRNTPITVPAAAQYRKKPNAGSAQIAVIPQIKVNKPVAIKGKTLLI